MNSSFKISLVLLLVSCHTKTPPTRMLLNKDFVDLRGRTGTTVFINSTPDTLKWTYVFFNWLPYTETRDSIKIAPGQKDSITVTYNYPDFIYVNNRFKVYNSPGRKLICNIHDYKSPKIKTTFSGSWAHENEYYMAYQQFLGHYSLETWPYYVASDQLKDWNLFPAKADSITQIRLRFLEQYKGILPEWFKKHEHRRLLYNEYSILSNALMAKEAHSGKKINVNKKYYDFEKLMSKENDMVLNDTYLNCMYNYFGDQARMANIKGTSRGVLAIDRLYHQTDIGDVSLMFSLGMLYRYDKLMYHTLMSTLKFKNPERKVWMDSLVQLKLEKPHTKPDTRATIFTDLAGKTVSLTDYPGKMVIVNFWAVWCAPCKAEFPYENRLYQQYKDKGLVVVNICFDSDKPSWIRDSGKYRLQTINLYSKQTDFNRLMKEFNLTALPASILINREGKITDNYFKRASSLTDNDIARILR